MFHYESHWRVKTEEEISKKKTHTHLNLREMFKYNQPNAHPSAALAAGCCFHASDTQPLQMREIVQ